MKRYFSVDEEFSGLDNLKHDLLSIGIVEIVEKNNIFYVDKTKTLYLELKPEHGVFDKQAMEINKLDPRNLYLYGTTSYNACNEIIHYLDLKEDDTAIFIGYCNDLDKIFLDQIFNKTKIENPFNYETIEISSLAMGRLNLEWGFSESKLEEILNIPPMKDDEKHNALEDAIHQAEEFCAIMSIH